MTSVRLPEEVDMQLNALCAVTRRSKSFYIKEALLRYLEDMEDYYISIDRIAGPKRKTLSTGEVLNALEQRK